MRLHDVTGKVQRARLRIAVQRFTMGELPRWTRILNLNRVNLEQKEQASLSGGHDFPGRVKYPLFRAQDIPLVRGMG